MSAKAEVVATKTANAVVSYREQLRQELATLNKRVAPPSGNKISLKGKTFTLPDGTSSPGPLAAIVLDWRTARVYYSKPFNAKEITAPDCWAQGSDVDGLAPPDSVKAKQNDVCAGCPKNEWGSAPTGKGKACKDTRKLAVVPAGATDETEPMTLLVSPTGVKHFDNYVNQLGSGDDGRMPIEVITHFAFDPDADYPTVRFGRPLPLDDEHLMIAMKLRGKAQPMLDRTPESD